MPRPDERLSAKPNLHRRLKYGQAKCEGRKFSFLSALMGLSQVPPADSNPASDLCLSLLCRVADNAELCPYLTDHFKLDCQTSIHLWSVA
jgi:hypothetical protein